MLLALTCHPDTPCDAVERIEVEVLRPRRTAMTLRFTAFGDTSQLVIPPWTRRSRADELWKTTCFEAFVASQSDSYYEFNLSPSGQAAVYRFAAYRQGMAPQPGVEFRNHERAVERDGLLVWSTLDLDRLGLQPDRAWRLGLSAVIEETGGRKSYWALAHTPGKPDFHHPDAFAAILEPA